jgi:hypothetical protein
VSFGPAWVTFVDKELFKEAIELAQGNQNIFDWIPAGCTEWDQCSVELSIVNMAELIELQSEQHTAIQALQAQLLQRDAQVITLQQECRALQRQVNRQEVALTNHRNRLGQITEYLGARDDAAAVLFGLR